MTQQEIFFDLLQFSIGVKDDIPTSLKKADWQEIYAMGKKQAVLGVLFHGIQRLPKEVAPEPKLLLQWITVAQQIRQANIRLNADCVNIQERFRKAGFRTCILKGQGNALLYPNAYIRTPGDIDILVEGGREKVMKYVNSICPGQTMRYHHVDFPVMKTDVEVHFTPSYMYNPIANSRLQRWFERNIDLQCSNVVPLPDGAGQISVPTTAFNVVYQLSHLYRHVFAEGIGLRQLVDYYYVLKSLPRGNTEVDTLQRELGQLGLFQFAGAVMYVLHEVLGMGEAEMIVPMNVREGKFLLDEIMIGGNFGKYDERYGNRDSEGKVRRFLRMSLHSARFIKHYPSEALCEPFFRAGFAVWKKIKGYK